MLGPAHDVAGTRVDIVEGDSLDVVLDEAVRRYGPEFRAMLDGHLTLTLMKDRALTRGYAVVRRTRALMNGSA